MTLENAHLVLQATNCADDEYSKAVFTHIFTKEMPIKFLHSLMVTLNKNEIVK
jgi:hypothetical protein